jgi:hypothetical protein
LQILRAACRACPGSIGLVLAVGTVGAAPAPAQAPTSASRELPRFTLRQIITGRNDSVARIPGPWFRAATTDLSPSQIMEAYRAAASRSGLQPLEKHTLATDRSHHVMGLYRRAELVNASRRTLEEIRDEIPSPLTRARFDRIFRPQGDWLVDLHDAAFAWARLRIPGLQWETTRKALAATHWVDPDQRSAENEDLVRALYGLAVLAATDSTAFADARKDVSRVDTVSASAVLTLLQGYNEAQRWYVEAVKFLLLEPWFPSGPGRSVRDYVRADWQSFLSNSSEVPLPEIETRWFGYPQAVPQYGVPSELFLHLIRAENPAAAEWIRRNGESRLLRVLRWLPAGDTAATVLQAGSETLRLSTVSRQSRESLNGFLEAGDLIAIDPAFSPLLALGAVVHEWQHLLFHRRQLEMFARNLGPRIHPIIELPGADPHLAEGFAEWSTERLLAPITRRWALLGLGELEKRADMAGRDTDDLHTSGYALVLALAKALGDPVATTRLLLRNAEYPFRIGSEPRLRRAWSRFRGASDHLVRTQTSRLLIPEVTFTIEDGFPDLIMSRILVPGTQ